MRGKVNHYDYYSQGIINYKCYYYLNWDHLMEYWSDGGNDNMLHLWISLLWYFSIKFKNYLKHTLSIFLNHVE